jgi:hypothetical protein
VQPVRGKKRTTMTPDDVGKGVESELGEKRSLDATDVVIRGEEGATAMLGFARSFNRRARRAR